MISAAVVGLGRAGVRHDAVGATRPRSHVGALRAVEGMKVCGLVDPDPDARNFVAELWPDLEDTPCHASLDEMPAGAVDLIVLSTPPEDRRRQAAKAVEKCPRLILIENPLAPSAAEAAEIALMAERAGVTLRVNFHRRFDPDHLALRKALTGMPAKVLMRYNKGLFNYVPHLVDLLLDWFGPVDRVQAFGAAHDDCLSFCCQMRAGFDAVIVGAGNLDYDQYEIDFLLPNARFELANGGCEKTVQTPVDDYIYSGYRQLGPRTGLGKVAPVGGLVECYTAIRDHMLNGAELPGCDGWSACEGLAVIEAAVASERNQGRPVTPKRHAQPSASVERAK